MVQFISLVQTTLKIMLCAIDITQSWDKGTGFTKFMKLTSLRNYPQHPISKSNRYNSKSLSTQLSYNISIHL